MGRLCSRWEKPTLLSALPCTLVRQLKGSVQSPRLSNTCKSSHTNLQHVNIKFLSLFLDLEEWRSLGRGSGKTELQFAKHILQQEDQLGRTQQNLLSHLKYIRKMLSTHAFIHVVHKVGLIGSNEGDTLHWYVALISLQYKRPTMCL